MSDVYALKQAHPDGSEWIQEFDTLDDAKQYRSENGGVLVRREAVTGRPGLWWVEVSDVTLAIESGQGPDGQLID